MEQNSDRDGPPTRKERPSTKLIFPRVLIIGTDSPLRAKIIALLQARGIRAEALESGIGAMQKIVEEALNTVVIMDQIDAMTPEAIVRLLRENPRTRELGIVAFVDPRAEPPDGIDEAFGKGTLSNLTDVILAVCEKRAGR